MMTITVLQATFNRSYNLDTSLFFTEDLNQKPFCREKTKSEIVFQRQWPRENNFILIIYHFSLNKFCMNFILASRDVLYKA